jgi:hypothetical protein
MNKTNRVLLRDILCVVWVLFGIEMFKMAYVGWWVNVVGGVCLFNACLHAIIGRTE